MSPLSRGALADLSGRRLWYIDSGGSGAAVVFLHAASGSSAMWEKQAPAIEAAGYRFVAYDRLGSGRSTLQPGSPPGLAIDDLENLAEFLHLDRFHLVGTAAGGSVALDYVLSLPHRVRSLVCANSIGGVQDEDYLALGKRMRPMPQFDALPVEIRELGPSFRAEDRTGTVRWMDLERLSRSSAPVPLQKHRQRITFALLETIRVPTLLITGGADLYTPPPVLRLFSARIRDCETLIVPEAGHSIFWEQPEVFNRAVLAFVGKY
jgi:pimeloyl-ACP methyl ester carboxylesterase